MKKETRDLIRDKLWKVTVALTGILFVLFVILVFLSCAFATTEDKTLLSLILKLANIMIAIMIAEMFCACAYDLLENTKQERRKRKRELNAPKINYIGHWKRQQIRYDYLRARYRGRLQNKKI